MLLIKILVTIFLFLSSLIFPLVIKVWGAIFYVGLFIPIILQKIWFGYWFQYKADKKFWKNILFSFLFIIASVVVDIFIIMSGIIEKAGYFIIPLGFCRVFFFFAIIYLWNHNRLKKQNIVIFNLFRFVKIIYILIAILIILGLLNVLYMHFIFAPIK